MGRFEDCLSEASSAETPPTMRSNRGCSRPELSPTETDPHPRPCGRTGGVVDPSYPLQKHTPQPHDKKIFKKPIDIVGEWCYSDTNIKKERRTETVPAIRKESKMNAVITSNTSYMWCCRMLSSRAQKMAGAFVCASEHTAERC